MKTVEEDWRLLFLSSGQGTEQSHTAGACWGFAKALMKPVHSRAFYWIDIGGQEIYTWGQLWGLLRDTDVGCLNRRCCLPPVSKRKQEVDGISLFPTKKGSQWKVFQLTRSFLMPVMTIHFCNILESQNTNYWRITVPFILIPLIKFNFN